MEIFKKDSGTAKTIKSKVSALHYVGSIFDVRKIPAQAIACQNISCLFNTGKPSDGFKEGSIWLDKITHKSTVIQHGEP